MISVDRVVSQIDGLIAQLVEIGLSSDQNFAVRRELSNNHVEITFKNAEYISSALRDMEYSEIYEVMHAARAYSVKLPDGALMQMMYLFKDSAIVSHRLAFFPSPHLLEFQNNPDIYGTDEIYADVIRRNVVPFPWRFDCDVRDGVYVVGTHPKSHFTLGQYVNCRIPVSAPVTPARFVDFVLRNFYNTAFRKYASELPTFIDEFDECIHGSEEAVVHIRLPRRAGAT